MMIGADDVLSFWLGPAGTPPLANAKKWFTRDDAFDAEIRARFGEAIHAATRGQLDSWRTTARGRLAFVILCDQLSRNAFRGTARMFAQDALALETAESALDLGDWDALGLIEKQFLLMPLMHAEDRARQKRSVELFEKILAESPPHLADNSKNSLKYARMHADIVERFGRFPHRNENLGRSSTPEEEEFLKGPGSSF
jgi:uncharacterized protein (DUF924 family)